MTRYCLYLKGKMVVKGIATYAFLSICAFSCLTQCATMDAVNSRFPQKGELFRTVDGIDFYLDEARDRDYESIGQVYAPPMSATFTPFLSNNSTLYADLAKKAKELGGDAVVFTTSLSTRSATVIKYLDK